MKTKRIGFKLLAALLAIFTVLASCPLTALAGEEILLTAYYFYDEERDEEHGDTVYTDVVYDEPVVIEAAEGLYRSVIEFENCTFNEGITVNTAGEVIVFFRGDCEIKENDEGDRVINVIGTDFDVLAEGGCIAEFHNAPSGTFFHSENSRLFADSDIEAMFEMDEFEDYCFFLDGAELYAAMPGFDFSTDVYFEDINGEGVLKKNLSVTCASRITAENCFFNEFNIGIADVLPEEGEELPCPVLDLTKNNGDRIFVRTRHFNGFNVNELPEDYVPAMLKLTGEIGGDLRLSGTVDLSELSFDYESGMIGIDTINDYNRIALGNHSAVITGGDPYASLEVFLGEEGELIDTVGLTNLRAFCGDVSLNADGAHIFGNGSVYIPGTREDVDYKLFYNREEIPFTKEIISEENKTHLTVEYDDVPEDIVIGDEKFCAEYMMDISFGNAFVSVPVRHKSLVKAEPNGAVYRNFYFDEPITVFAACEEDFAYVDFTDCTFADGADITVIPGRTHIDVNFWGETVVEDEDGEPNLFEVKTNDSRYLFNTDVYVSGLPAGYEVGDTECGHFGVNGITPGFVFNRNGVEIAFGDKENARRGFCLDRNCNNWHDYEGWENYPPHDDCSEEDQSSGIYVYGDIAGITVDGTSYDYVTTGQLCADVTIELSGECGRNGYFSVSNILEEDLLNEDEAEVPVCAEAYAVITGSLSGADTLEIRGRADISGLAAEDTQIVYRAEGVESSLKTGSHNVTVRPAEYGDAEFTVYADEGSNVVCPSYLLGNMTLYANGEDVLSLNGIYTENGDVYIPCVNADGTEYSVFANGEQVFGDEGDAPEISDGMTVLHIPEDKKADAYDVSARLNGVSLSTDCYSANTIIASENVTSVEGRTFSGEVNIITIGDKYNGLSSGVVFRDCIFENDTFINFTANDDNAFLRFEGETNVGENCFIRLRTDDDELKYGVNWTDINVENALSGFGYLCDELDVNIGGESENDNYNICGAVVSTGDAENKWFNIRFHTNWYDENDIGKALELTDNITGVEYIQSEEEDRPAINEFCFNRVYVSDPSVDLHVENRTGEHGMIRVRTSSPNPDDPWDVENWEMSGWNTDSHAVITGNIKGFDLETTGNADISELDFDYGDEENENEILIGTWNPVSCMNVGNKSVSIVGSSDLPVCITAEDGAFIRENEQGQTVIINGGDESIVDLSSAHIFGDGDYGVYIGKALSEEELDNIKLYCCSDEPNDYGFESFPEENKTHLYPNTEEYYDGDIGNWYLECTSGGITVLKRIVHKAWMCEHENREMHFIDGMELPTCEHGGYVFYICPDCEQMWWSYEDMRSENGEHTPETIEGFTATCTEDGLTDGEFCSVCGEVLTEQEVIPATGHTFVRDEERDVPATCTEEGIEAYACECGETDDKIIPATGHVFVRDEENDKPATCTEEGIEAYSCECGETDDVIIPATGHTFVRDEENDKPVTCTENGKEAYKCSADGCGATDEIVIYASGHSVVRLAGKAPTCTEDGLTTGAKCSKCETVLIRQEVIKATGHKAVTLPAVPATCEEDGKTEGSKCAVCGDILTAQTTVPKTGHTAVLDEAVAVGCGKAGLTAGSHCSVCGEVLVKQETIPAKEHNFTADKDRSKEATCTEAGLEAYTCTLCGAYADITLMPAGHKVVKLAGTPATCTSDGLTDGAECSVCHTVLIEQTKLDKLGHKAVTLPAVAATCEQDGKTEGSYCAVCGETLTAQITVPATGHTEVADAAVPVGCGKDGLTAGSHCSVCGEVLIKQETIPAKEHNFAADKDRSKEATCTEAGLEAYTCTLCGAYADITLMPAGHKIEKIAGTPATCTEDGLTDGAKCSVCRETLIAQTKIDKLGHKAVALPAVAATCTSEGLTEGSYCAVCKVTLVEQIKTDKLRHVSAVIPAVAATCTATGLTEGSKCSVCGEILTAQTTVKATGHTEAVLEAIDPTCITEGRTEGKYCSVCKAILVMPEAIGTTDHTPVKDIAVAATCTLSGLTEGSHCLVCDTVLTKQKSVPAPGHTWDKGTVTKAATCKEAGVMTFRCTVCGATKTESIAKLTTHTYDAGKVTKAATCKEAGVKTFTCTVCGATKTESIAKLTTHTYDAGKCTVCGAADPNYDPMPAFRKGDVDNDGKVTAADARLALRASVGFKGDKDNDGKVIDWTDKTCRAFLAGNVDPDEKMTAADARLILRASVGLEKF